MKPTLRKLPDHGLWKFTTPDNGKTRVTVCFCGFKGDDDLEFERHLKTTAKKGSI